MGMLIIIFAVCLGLGIFGAILERDGALVGIGALGGLLLSFLWAFISIAVSITCFPADTIYETETYPICALKDSGGNHGSFFLGSGSYKSEMYYWYLTEEDDGAKILNKVSATKAKVYDNEKEEPRIEINQTYNSNPVARFFFFTYGENVNIYIPEGSIDYTYQVDLE